MLIYVMLLSLILEKDAEWQLAEWILLPSCWILGLLVTRVGQAYMIKRLSKQPGTLRFCVKAFFCFWDNRMFLVELNKKGVTIVETVDSQTFEKVSQLSEIL